MIRKSLLIAGITALGVTAAAAQSCQDTITARQDLMKKSGAAGKTAFDMIKGATPFDLEKTKSIFAAFAEDASKMPTLFPDCSKTGDHTTAAPAIWDKSADFKALIEKFAADVRAGQDNTKDIDTFKANIDTISKDCTNCHQSFRVRKS